MGQQMTPAKVSNEKPSSTHNIHHLTQCRVSVDILYLKSLNVSHARSQYLRWLQAGVCRLTSGGSDYSSDSSDQCPPPLLLSTGPSHHRDTESAPSAIVTNTNHPQQAWLKIMHFGFICIFVMLKYFFEYVKIFLLLFPIAGCAAPEPECGEQSAECGPVSLLSQ